MKRIGIGILCLLSAQQVYGYIDPGTGSTIIGSMGPVIAALFAAAAAFLARHFWHPIKRFFKRK